MGINDLQVYLESPSLEGGAVSVDLLKIARNVTQRQQPHNANRKIRPIGNKLKLLIDAENCLDRLYGGYFSDWACGGQWNRMIQFLSLLTRAVERGNIELAVVFNGTIETCRMNEWANEQANTTQKAAMVLKHIKTKATPPPKVWWTPPTCLRSALRMALRHLGVSVMCTMDDHHQEVIAYCREYGFHGLLADDAEYAAFDPPRYFSSENLKLTYKGSLETKEYMVNELTKSLQLTQEQLCVMAALMGNFLLTESDLQDFHRKVGISNNLRDNKSPAEINVKILADFVRTLPPPSNMDALVSTIIGDLDEKHASKFRQSVQYYLNGTASGFLNYCAPPPVPTKDKNTIPVQNNNEVTNKENDNDLKLPGAGFASETTEQEEESLQNYKLATVNSVMSSNYLDQNGTPVNSHADSSDCNGISNGSTAGPSSGTKVNPLVSSSSSNTSSIPSSPKHGVENLCYVGMGVLVNLVTPVVSPDVLRTASLRHQRGLMASMILHVLSTREVRLPCLMESPNAYEFPPIHEIYQTLRERVYAVLFNLHHLRYVHAKKKEAGEISENSPRPEIIVKEWIYNEHIDSKPYQNEVYAEALPWAVPTLQRLWFGPALDDKRRRMRALLSCLNSDTPLILNTGYVPQHMLIMACVLRYIMSYHVAIVRRHELDAFLCQAFNVDLMNPQYLQELTLSVVTSRGVQLATLFMQGVDMALLANDACGAPLPWLMCCPWLYFDGKLFHHTLNRSAHSKNILELCENHIERVVKVERMRKAILEGLDVKFAKVPLTPFPGQRPSRMLPLQETSYTPLPPNRIPAGMRPRPISSRGGQLQVAGVVVGSWGANYGYQQNMRQQNPMSAGGYQGRGRGMMGPPGPPSNFSQQNMPRGRGQGRKPGPPAFPMNKKNNTHRKRNNPNRPNRSQTSQEHHTITIKTESGDIPADEVILNSDGTLNAGGKSEDCIRSSEHKGQGDAPNIVNTTH